MLISVVVPAYNAEQWVGETIASVLAQTYRDIELIVVDDGSSDNTIKAATEALNGSEISYQIHRQTNKGVAAARNWGWRAARGAWVQFLDADDLLRPEKIRLQVALLKGGTDAAVLYSDWQKLVLKDDRWIPIDIRKPVIRSDAIADLLSDRNFLQIGCMLFNKSALEYAGGFDTSHEPIEDIGLYVKIAIGGGRFVKAPSTGPVVSYRDLPRSLSKIDQQKFINSCIKNGKLAELAIDKNLAENQRTIDAIVELYSAGARYFAGQDWDRFGTILSEIYALRPNYLPRGPLQLRLISRIAGYSMAERLAVLYRQGKTVGGELLRGQLRR